MRGLTPLEYRVLADSTGSCEPGDDSGFATPEENGAAASLLARGLAVEVECACCEGYVHLEMTPDGLLLFGLYDGPPL